MTSLQQRRLPAWNLKCKTLSFNDGPKLMGIVNVTPDSFSDGGQHFSTDEAVAHAIKLVNDGADILDVGGESTRPYSKMVSVDEEMSRVIPVIERLASEIDVPISIDTSKSSVASAAIAAGAEIINDISGFCDPQMVDVARNSNAGICAMHMQGTPQNMQDDPQYSNVVEDIFEYLCRKYQELIGLGISREKICLDPGVGFGKTHEHNITLLKKCARFNDVGCPILIGHSRKGFIGKILGDKSLERDTATAAIAIHLYCCNTSVIRVHNVKITRQVLDVFNAIQ